MLTYSTEDVISVLKKATNLNSALKNFLKKEIKPGDPAGRFVKDLKDLCEAADKRPMEQYIASSRPAYDGHLLAIGKFAHVETVNPIVATIVERYADEFNGTYESTGEAITVTNQKRFDEIVKEALGVISDAQASAGYPDSVFFKNLVLLSIFDRPVLEYILQMK